MNSLAHPGRNTTGVSMFAPELDGKRQDLLIEAVPNARRMAALADSTMSQSGPRHFDKLKTAAHLRGIELLVFSKTVTMPRWSVDIIRKRAEHLGIVEAKDEAEAIKKAADMYDIPPERRNRITVRQVNRDV